MKTKLFFQILSLILLFLLASCGSPESAPTSISTATPDPADQTILLVQGYVDAYHALDADTFMSYFADDAEYYDMAMKDYGVLTREALARGVHSSFIQEGFKVEINSYFVSRDGKYAALEGTYYKLNKYGRQVGMPTVIILEIRDGRIIRETDYYDSGPIK